jgi:hypothetical protein
MIVEQAKKWSNKRMGRAIDKIGEAIGRIGAE